MAFTDLGEAGGGSQAVDGTWHPGELAVQRQAGTASRVSSSFVRNHIPSVAAEFLADQPFVFLSATAPDGAVWTSMLSGAPGFAQATDHELLIEATWAAGDPLGDVIGSEQVPVGLVAVDFTTRRRMRVNGRATYGHGLLRAHTDEVFSNCPKYIPLRSSSSHPVERDEPAIETLAHEDGGVLSTHQSDLVRSADSFFIGTRHHSAGMDTSFRGGNPGFVRMEGDRLEWPDYQGNGMFMTLGNIDQDARAGLLVPDWVSGGGLCLTGEVTVTWGDSASPSGNRSLTGRTMTFKIRESRWVNKLFSSTWNLDELSKFNPPVI